MLDREEFDELGVLVSQPGLPIAALGLNKYGKNMDGYAVHDTYTLDVCYHDLLKAAESWPMPEQSLPHLDEYSRNLKASNPDSTEEQRFDWLRASANRERVETLICQAIRQGRLRAWIAPNDSTGILTEPSAIAAIDRRSLGTGRFIPLTLEFQASRAETRHKLWEQKLFVKRSEWVGFKSRCNNSSKSASSGRGATTLGHEEVVAWCSQWIGRQKQSGLSSSQNAAWTDFHAEHPGNNRDDIFRPGWHAAQKS